MKIIIDKQFRGYIGVIVGDYYVDCLDGNYRCSCAVKYNRKTYDKCKHISLVKNINK